jgi:hypothetical protein
MDAKHKVNHGPTSQPLSKPLSIATIVARVVVAIILLQTLFFKFTGAPESIYIFKTMGMEPWGRYASGVGELVAAVLLLVPKPLFQAIGSAMTLGVISGAIVSHLTKLGIKIPNQDGTPGDDGGLLFILACVVFVSAAFILFMRYKHLLALVGIRKPSVI